MAWSALFALNTSNFFGFCMILHQTFFWKGGVESSASERESSRSSRPVSSVERPVSVSSKITSIIWEICKDIFLNYCEAWDFYASILSTVGFKTLSGHLKVQKTPKDLTVFSVQMLCSWFCSRDMGHRHLCFGFCRFGDFQNHERDKNPCERNRFHADFSQCFCCKKNMKNNMQI